MPISQTVVLMERAETGIRPGTLKSYICCHPLAVLVYSGDSMVAIPSYHIPVSGQVLTVLDVANLRSARGLVVSQKPRPEQELGREVRQTPINWTGVLTERVETEIRSGVLNCYPVVALVQTVYSGKLVLAIPSHYSPVNGLPNWGLEKPSAENLWETSAKHSVHCCPVHADLEDIQGSDATT